MCSLITISRVGTDKDKVSPHYGNTSNDWLILHLNKVPIHEILGILQNFVGKCLVYPLRRYSTVKSSIT